MIPRNEPSYGVLENGLAVNTEKSRIRGRSLSRRPPYRNNNACREWDARLGDSGPSWSRRAADDENVQPYSKKGTERSRGGLGTSSSTTHQGGFVTANGGTVDRVVWGLPERLCHNPCHKRA